MKNIKLSVLALSFVVASASAAETQSFFSKGKDLANSIFSKGYGAIKTGATLAKNGLVTGATAVKDAGVVTLAAAKAHPYIVATAALAAAAVAIYNRKAIVSGVKNACNKVCKVVSNNKKTTLGVAAVLAAVVAHQYGYTTQAYNFLKSFVVKAPEIAEKVVEVAAEVV